MSSDLAARDDVDVRALDLDDQAFSRAARSGAYR